MQVVSKMETLIAEIVQKLYTLPELKVLEVANFVDFLTGSDDTRGSDRPNYHESFETIADQLAEAFETIVGSAVPALSDYAVSRAGIYEEHP